MKDSSFAILLMRKLTTTPIRQIKTNKRLYYLYPSLSLVIYFSLSIISPANIGIKVIEIV
jgi:hypothetical protein